MPFQRGLSPHPPVALLAEGVDRNSFNIPQIPQLATVALLAEGVDRNSRAARSLAVKALSPSSRRAWIEIAKARMVNPALSRRPPRGGRG